MLNAKLNECKCMQKAKKNTMGNFQENKSSNAIFKRKVGLNAKSKKTWGFQAGFENRRRQRATWQRTG